MKILVLIIMAFFLSGCTADYELTITEDNQVHESILVHSTNSTESKQLSENVWPLKVYYMDPDVGENPEKIEGVTYYNDNLFFEKGFYHRNLTYTYPIDTFSSANSIQSCYENFYVTEDKKEDSITLSTSPEFLCMDLYPNLTEVNVQIKVEKPVLYSNASSSHDSIYEWKITPENKDQSGIIIAFPKKYSAKKEEDISSKIVFALIALGVFFLFLIGIIVYKIKKAP